jgi:hypothetical protein
MGIIQLPSSERVQRVRFNGIIYRRYPRSKQGSDRNYFRAGVSDIYKGFGYLHRDVWIAAHGPIPDDHEVDHKNGDHGDNSLGNLHLLTISEHKEKHAAEQGDRSRRVWSSHSDAKKKQILAAAAVWHSTPEGNEWHRQHGVRTMSARKPVKRACTCCGKEYESKIGNRTDKFCSNSCRSKDRRQRGVDNEVRTCSNCAAEFTANRYSKTRNCSPKCARASCV